MIDRVKVDSKLGKEVHDFLLLKGVETPLMEIVVDEDIQLKEIESSVRDIMVSLNLDLDDDSLRETPKRVAKMYVKEIFGGLSYDHFPKCTQIENKMGYDEMVVERDITVLSVCEHHLAQIDGTAAVAYIPKEKVLGLSKLNRIVEFFSRRPQVQERLTEQIFHTLSYILKTDDIAVVIDAEHYCVKSRGVGDINSSTITSKLGGRFKELPSLRSEFLSLINKS